MRGIYTHFDRACYWLYTRSDGLRLCFGLCFVFSMRVIYILYIRSDGLQTLLFVVLFVACCFIPPSPGVVVPLSASMSRQEAVLGKEEMTKRMQMQQVN